MISGLVILFASLLVPSAVRADELCPLCETADTLPVRFDHILGSGMTCLDIYLEVSGLTPGSQACQAQQNLYRAACCDDEPPPPTYVPPPTIPVYNGPVGDEPDCPICQTEEYPGIPGAFIVARYVGDYSCAQLYDRGFNGLIPWFMCGPLQDFAYPVCGCGEYNPRCQRDESECWGNRPPPTPAPVSQPPPTSPNPPPPPPVPAPTAEPPVVAPTAYTRKVRPAASKYTTKLYGGSGGSAGRVRGGGRVLKGESKPEAATETEPQLREAEEAEEAVPTEG